LIYYIALGTEKISTLLQECISPRREDRRNCWFYPFTGAGNIRPFFIATSQVTRLHCGAEGERRISSGAWWKKING
jgi:hypothetical protein